MWPAEYLIEKKYMKMVTDYCCFDKGYITCERGEDTSDTAIILKNFHREL